MILRQQRNFLSLLKTFTLFRTKIHLIKALVLTGIFFLTCDVSAQIDLLIEQSAKRYDGTSKIVINTAERIPEDRYDFRPVEGVRSFSEMIAHMVESKYYFCALVLGDQDKAQDLEGVITTKEELIAALREATDYCTKAHAAMDGETAVSMVKLHGELRPKLEVLNTNQMHTIMHYGSLVTYLRMIGKVPPTSDMEFMMQLMRN